MLDGHRAGLRMRSEGRPLHLGRDESSDLRLDPEHDLEVSGSHAVVERTDDGWRIRDLASRNGTWVGDVRVREDHRLRNGDRVRLGPAGPTLAVRIGGKGRTAVLERLSRENLRLKRGVLALVAGVALAGAAGAWAWSRRGADWEQERARLLAGTDSLLAESRATIERLQGQVGGLADALETSRAEVGSLRAAVNDAERRSSEPGTLAELRDRLGEATRALARQQLAASLDFEAIEARNRPALAMLFVEPAAGGVTTATAFAVRSDGTLVTNRHAVVDDQGRSATRVGVQFADSRQVWRARVLLVAQDADLAVLKVDDIEGGNPVVTGLDGLHPPPEEGSPAALLGFPLAAATDTPRPLVTAGVVLSAGERELRIQGYGAEGGSGSPVFDAEGRLVAVLYGGTGEGPARTLLAVPASAVRALLERL